MLLKLNIQEDTELRTELKKMLKGQVLAIVREEVMQDAMAEFKRKFFALSPDHFSAALEKAAIEVLKTSQRAESWNKEIILPIVERLVENALQRVNWEITVRQIAENAVKTALNKNIAELIKNNLQK